MSHKSWVKKPRDTDCHVNLTFYTGSGNTYNSDFDGSVSTTQKLSQTQGNGGYTLQYTYIHILYLKG